MSESHQHSRVIFCCRDRVLGNYTQNKSWRFLRVERLKSWQRLSEDFSFVRSVSWVISLVHRRCMRVPCRRSDVALLHVAITAPTACLLAERQSPMKRSWLSQPCCRSTSSLRSPIRSSKVSSLEFCSLHSSAPPVWTSAPPYKVT